MQLVCPECMGTLAPTDAKTLHCITHGGIYQVLFVRGVTGRRLPSAQALVGVACSKHPRVAAAGVCLWCGSPICAACGLAQPDGRFLCSDCMSGNTATQSRPMAVPSEQKCIQHPNVKAEHICVKCGQAICATCAFTFPGNIVICPSCAVEGPSRISRSRRRDAWWSFGLSILSTVVAAISIIAASTMTSEIQIAIVDKVATIASFALALLGMGLGFGVKERNQPTPAIAWVGIIWSSVLVLFHFLIMLVSSVMG